MADPLETEDLGSGMLRTAAQAKKYRPQYNQVVIDAASTGEEPPAFEEWVKDKIQQDQQDQAAKGGVMQRLRRFVAK